MPDRVELFVADVGGIRRVGSTPAVAAGAAAVLSEDTNLAALLTTEDGDLATNSPISLTPTQDGSILVFVNSGLQNLKGDKTGDCYFSSDAGTTAKAIAAIDEGDKLYWNGSVAGFQLSADDRITFAYCV